MADKVRWCHKKIHFELRGELRGYPTVQDEGNPQPILGNVRMLVPRQAQRLVGDDSQTNKPTTSAPASSLKRQEIVRAHE